MCVFVCLKSILFRVVQVFMFDVAFCPPSPSLLFPSLADDVKVDIWMVLLHGYNNYHLSSTDLEQFFLGFVQQFARMFYYRP